MVANTPFRAAVLSIATSLAGAATAPAQAQSNQSPVTVLGHPETLTRIVPFGDLALATTAGQRSLVHRVSSAVREVCPDSVLRVHDLQFRLRLPGLCQFRVGRRPSANPPSDKRCEIRSAIRHVDCDHRRRPLKQRRGAGDWSAPWVPRGSCRRAVDVGEAAMFERLRSCAGRAISPLEGTS